MNWLDEIANQYAKKLAQDIQNKLKRKGLTINVEKIVLEEKFENGIYRERYAIECKFVPLKNTSN